MPASRYLSLCLRNATTFNTSLLLFEEGFDSPMIRAKDVRTERDGAAPVPPGAHGQAGPLPPDAGLGSAQAGVRQIDGPPEFGGALPVDLKDLAHRRLEVVETRTLAARGDQLGVGADRQAERTVLCF